MYSGFFSSSFQKISRSESRCSKFVVQTKLPELGMIYVFCKISWEGNFIFQKFWNRGFGVICQKKLGTTVLNHCNLVSIFLLILTIFSKLQVTFSRLKFPGIVLVKKVSLKINHSIYGVSLWHFHWISSLDSATNFHNFCIIKMFEKCTELYVNSCHVILEFWLWGSL